MVTLVMNMMQNNNYTSMVYPHILLVEDEPIVQYVHKTYLKYMSCKVDTTDDSSHALLLSKNQYALIVLDIGLPNLNGIQLAKEIRVREQNNMQPYTPIIAITIYSPPEIKDECIAAGINEIAHKPISFDEFRKLIFRWLPVNKVSAC